MKGNSPRKDLPIYDQVEVIETIACIHCTQIMEVGTSRCPNCGLTQRDSPPRRRRLLVVAALLAVLLGLFFVLQQIAEPDPITSTAKEIEAEATEDRPKTSTQPNNLPTKTLTSENPNPEIDESTQYPEVNYPYDLKSRNLANQCAADVAYTAECRTALNEFESSYWQFLSAALGAGDSRALCSITRQILLDLINVSDQRVRVAYNGVYQSTAHCRANDVITQPDIDGLR